MNLEGLILGGVIIGTLGVLDDVTITQASAVWEIHLAILLSACGSCTGPRCALVATT